MQEPPGSTHLAARRHNRDVSGALVHEKRCFLLFAQQEPPGGSTVPPGAIFHFWALGATTFLVCAIFVKMHFPIR